MKFLISIWVAFLFLLIWILKLNWYLDLDEIYLFWVEDMWKTDISWFLNFVKSLLIVPIIINIELGEMILNFLNNYFIIDSSKIFLGIIFIFYFLFSYLILLLLWKLSFRKEKYILSISIIVLYLFLLSYIEFVIL